MNKKYMVLKMLHNVKVHDISVKLNGCSGYIPVFDSIDEAKEFTNNGEFQMVEIEVGKPAKATGFIQ